VNGGFWREADIRKLTKSVKCHVRMSNASSDHLVGGSKQRCRNGQAERPCCFEGVNVRDDQAANAVKLSSMSIPVQSGTITNETGFFDGIDRRRISLGLTLRIALDTFTICHAPLQ
jgi:hypothetical protein